MTDETRADRLAIREVVESWAIARDSADWDWFRAQWHDDGYMMATWFQGPKEDFIRVSADGFDKGDGRWAIVLRQPIYEKDRLDPVRPGAAIEFDRDLLERFPEGYRHLAYLQVQAGYPVKADMPGLRGPEVEALYARGAAWLAGQPVAP